MKRFLICRARSDGRQEIYDHTDLTSEARRFAALGYGVAPRSQMDRLPRSGGRTPARCA